MPSDGGERLPAGAQFGSLRRDQLRNTRNNGIALLDVERDPGEGSTPLRSRRPARAAALPAQRQHGRDWRVDVPAASPARHRRCRRADRHRMAGPRGESGVARVRGRSRRRTVAAMGRRRAGPNRVLLAEPPRGFAAGAVGADAGPRPRVGRGTPRYARRPHCPADKTISCRRAAMEKRAMTRATGTKRPRQAADASIVAVLSALTPAPPNVRHHVSSPTNAGPTWEPERTNYRRPQARSRAREVSSTRSGSGRPNRYHASIPSPRRRSSNGASASSIRETARCGRCTIRRGRGVE